MTKPLYRGYSSVANHEIDTALFDLNLVKQDILNHFNTRIGERVGRPSFGSIIWNMIFDPGDPRTEALIVQDAQRIISMDPRVKLLEMIPSVSLDTHDVSLQIHLKAVEFDMDTWFTVTFSGSQM